MGGAKSRPERRHRPQAAVLDAAGEATEFSSAHGERELMLGDVGIEASSASGHEASGMDAPAVSSSAIATAAGPSARDTSLPPLSERRGSATSAGHELEHKKATHIASVSSAPGAGGVASEYMESKRLGKLFDEWKKRQNENDEEGQLSARPSAQDTGSARSRHATFDFTPGASGSPKAKAAGSKGRGRGDAAGGAKGRRTRTLTNQTAQNETEQRGSVVDDATDCGSDVSGHRGARISESKLVGRLFQVVTNPKVTGEAAGDGESTRRVPSYVEGFPTLNLMRLHRGPWRLEF